MVTDPISDFLTRVRNAQSAGHKVVDIPASKIKKEITKILFDQGYILNFKFEDNAVQGNIKIALKYDKAIIMSLSIQSPQDAVMWLYSFLAYQN